MKMAKTKGPSKKQQKRGIDFKKIKRKMGRKLPPPKNTTNTEIKSKAIVLPEQSVASEKAGLAVSKKGLTLKELLQHTSHHNAKVRKDALMGMKDLFLKYPEELKLHRYAVVEKLRERISDDDKTVRENLYQLLKSVIFSGCKEDNQGPVISLMMVYIFNAMTHLAIDVRLMAFKFFDLAVQYHPPSFFSYAEKILQNYEDILWKNQFYLEDKGKLKNVLAGLVRCLVLLPSSKEVNLLEKNVHEQKILHAFEPDVPIVFAEYSDIIKKLKDIVPVLVNCFQDFLPVVHDSLDAQSFDCMHSILRSIDLAVLFFIHGILQGHPESQPLDQSFSSALLKKLLSVFPLCPTHHLSGKDDDRYVILNIAITEIFMHLSEWICPPGDLFEKFLTFVEYVLLEKMAGKELQLCAIWQNNWRKADIYTDSFYPKTCVTGAWKLEASPSSGLTHALRMHDNLSSAFTKTFQDCSPESSVKLACLAAIEEMIISRKDLLCTDVSDSELFDYHITWIRELPTLLVLLGDKHPSSSQVVLHLLLCLGQHSLLYDEMQCLLKEFYSTYQDEGNICYGPFLRLARDSQELSICCLYYFSQLDSNLLKSIASCCLCHELDSFMLFRIIEVLHSAYKAGHIQISDHVSFFITLVSRFKVFPENIFPATENNMKTSNRGTFKSLTNVVCSCLSQMGDNSIVFVILEKVILEQISLKPPLDNSCAMLRMLIALDTKPSRLSERSICSLSDVLSAYLIDIAHCAPKDGDEGVGSIHEQTWCYYLLPGFFLFDRSHKLLNLVLKVMGSSINGSSASLLSGYHIRYAKGNSCRINATVSVLLWMQRDAKVQQILYSFKEEIDHISRSVCSLQSSEEINVPIEERHIIKHAIDRLRSLTSSLHR
ncbi:hypothetical protein SADUNF_Sadunf06G0159900 [Salix dunnii]|uniref:Pre-rRNA-processing protein Ipi1 N-terminal domain-containing protein n=1 Tax=Salix dunnii TaxID=1413687 RepID=A0A835K2I4_9ROSI|nr:hypothetical protein SADUNF_Sadunf06G0159900 [Salix dunnii]